MLRRMDFALCMAARRFADDAQGSVAVIFAIALIPMLFAIGAAINYSRAVAF